VSYMVLYTGLDGGTSFGRCDELPGAVAEVERLRNEQSIEDAKIYRLEEVKFEIKPYFRVELPETAADAPSAVAPPSALESDEPPLPVDPPVWATAPAPSVEAPSMIIPPPPPPPPPAAVAPMSFDSAHMVDDEDAGVGSRRGLFGR